MELRHLRYFLAVAEEGHFGRAAGRLNIVQPALSMQIKALENELGGALFIRTSRRVELTEAGLLLQAEATRTLEQLEHTRLAVGRSLRGETGRVRVGFAGNAIFSGKMICDLRAFRQAWPDAELVVQEVTPLRQADAIRAGQLDVGYAPDTGKPTPSGLEVSRIGDWEMRVAMAADHPLAEHPHITVEMLAHQPLILYDAHDMHGQLLTVLTRILGERLTVAHRSSSTLSVLAIAAAGMGIALVPAPLQQVNIPGLTYRHLDAAELSANLVLIYRADEPAAAVSAYLARAMHEINN